MRRMMELSEADATSGGSVSDVRTIIVCNWQDCPFVADVTTCFAEAQRLTPRETEVLGLVVDGLDVGAIAERLVISVGTVKAHLHRIYRKCGVSGRSDLMRAFGAFGRGSGRRTADG